MPHASAIRLPRPRHPRTHRGRRPVRRRRPGPVRAQLPDARGPPGHLRRLAPAPLHRPGGTARPGHRPPRRTAPAHRARHRLGRRHRDPVHRAVPAADRPPRARRPARQPSLAGPEPAGPAGGTAARRQHGGRDDRRGGDHRVPADVPAHPRQRELRRPPRPCRHPGRDPHRAGRARPGDLSGTERSARRDRARGDRPRGVLRGAAPTDPRRRALVGCFVVGSVLAGRVLVGGVRRLTGARCPVPGRALLFFPMGLPARGASPLIRRARAFRAPARLPPSARVPRPICPICAPGCLNGAGPGNIL
ncbi:hypothetical protein KPATCC21470_2173 [Kitasatospora purpeofusca]